VRYLRGEISLAQASEEIKMNSRRYAKRQMTWFRRDERVRWFDGSQYACFDALTEDLIRTIQSDWNKRGEDR
jgi:tRNA dimethylallyltransferase